MKTRSFFTSLLLLAVGLPSAAADRFQLPACDKLEPAPAVQLPAVKLPADAAPARANSSLMDQARKVNALPLPLIPTASEKSAIDEASLDAERRQITSLWDATIYRSTDIQMVINALQPNSDPNKTRGQALKMIGGAMFNGAMQVAPLALGNTPGLRLGTGAAASMFDAVLRPKPKDNRPDLSPASLAGLYSMIRRTADRLVDAYRGYRFSLDAAVYAEEEVDDIHKVITGDGTNSADASLYLDLSMKRALREVRLCQQQILLYRKQLVDLSGEHAVSELDGQIAEEHNALARLTGSSSWRNPLEYTPPSSASTMPRLQPKQ